MGVLAHLFQNIFYSAVQHKSCSCCKPGKSMQILRADLMLSRSRFRREYAAAVSSGSAPFRAFKLQSAAQIKPACTGRPEQCLVPGKNCGVHAPFGKLVAELLR